MPAKPEKSNANRRTHMIYSVQGDFIHESRAHTSTKQIAEFLLNDPETLQFTVKCEDTGESFHCFGTLTITSIQEHSYECPDSETEKRNREDHSYNQHVLAHLGPTNTRFVRNGIDLLSPRERKKKNQARLDHLDKFIC